MGQNGSVVFFAHDLGERERKKRKNNNNINNNNNNNNRKWSIISLNFESAQKSHLKLVGEQALGTAHIVYDILPAFDRFDATNQNPPLEQ